MNLNFRHLHAFVAVVETGSLCGAAQLINLSQPALSRMIRNLEIELSVRLFERHSHGMTLTIQGETFLRHARMLLLQMKETEDALAEVQGSRRGTVRIGALAAVARTLIPAASAALLENAPNLRFEVVEGSVDRLEIELLAGDIDLMIAGPVQTKPEIRIIAECRLDDYYKVICSSKHPLAVRKAVSLEDILHQDWILSAKGSAPRVLFEATLASLGYGCPNIAVETASTSVVIAFVGVSRLLTWLPTQISFEAQTSGRVSILNIPPLVLRRRFFVYCRSAGVLAPAAVQLLEKLDEIY